MSTHGPAFDERLDGERISRQHEHIRRWMLEHNAWRTLFEIREALGYSDSSISAQLRHLRKPQYGSYRVEKRRRDGSGTWEYRVFPPGDGVAMVPKTPLPAGLQTTDSARAPAAV